MNIIYKNKVLLATLSIGICLLSSCASKKDYLYFQDNQTQNNKTIKYVNSKIQINDILSVKISALHPETAAPYNFDNSLSTNSSFIETLKLQGYLVTPDGNIIFPIIGAIQAYKKTTSELEIEIKNKLEEGEHVKNAIVGVRVLNSKITILGEVNKPGTYTITEQNITLPQALGFAGDLTAFAKRKDILIIRDQEGKQIVGHIDITKTDWFNGPFYFVKQNDVIIVNPNNVKVKSSGHINGLGTVLTITSILLSTVVILTR